MSSSIRITMEAPRPELLRLLRDNNREAFESMLLTKDEKRIHFALMASELICGGLTDGEGHVNDLGAALQPTFDMSDDAFVETVLPQLRAAVVAAVLEFVPQGRRADQMSDLLKLHETIVRTCGVNVRAADDALLEVVYELLAGRASLALGRFKDSMDCWSSGANHELLNVVVCMIFALKSAEGDDVLHGWIAVRLVRLMPQVSARHHEAGLRAQAVLTQQPWLSDGDVVAIVSHDGFLMSLDEFECALMQSITQ